MRNVHEMTYMERVTIDQVSGQLIDVSFDLNIAVCLGISFTPSCNTSIGCELDIDEIFACSWIPLYNLDIGDFQCFAPGS